MEASTHDVPLLDGFLSNIVHSGRMNYCSLCLRTGDERKMVTNHSLKQFTAAIVLEKHWQHNLMCYICHKQARNALKFIKGMSFASALDTIFPELLYQKRHNRDPFREEDFKKLLQNYQLAGSRTSSKDWEEDLRRIRKATSIRRTHIEIQDIQPEENQPSVEDGQPGEPVEEPPSQDTETSGESCVVKSRAPTGRDSTTIYPNPLPTTLPNSNMELRHADLLRTRVQQLESIADAVRSRGIQRWCVADQGNCVVSKEGPELQNGTKEPQNSSPLEQLRGSRLQKYSRLEKLGPRGLIKSSRLERPRPSGHQKSSRLEQPRHSGVKKSTRCDADQDNPVVLRGIELQMCRVTDNSVDGAALQKTSHVNESEGSGLQNSTRCEQLGPSGLQTSTRCEQPGPSGVKNSTRCEQPGLTELQNSTRCEQPGPSGLQNSTRFEQPGPSGLQNSTRCEQPGPSGLQNSSRWEQPGPSGLQNSSCWEQPGPNGLQNSSRWEQPGPSGLQNSSDMNEPREGGLLMSWHMDEPGDDAALQKTNMNEPEDSGLQKKTRGKKTPGLRVKKSTRVEQPGDSLLQMGTCVVQPESSGAQTNNLLEQPSKSDLQKSTQVDQSGSGRGMKSPRVEQPGDSLLQMGTCVDQPESSGSLINNLLEQPSNSDLRKSTHTEQSGSGRGMKSSRVEQPGDNLLQMGTCVDQPESSGSPINNLLEQPSNSDLRKSTHVEQTGSGRGMKSPRVEQPGDSLLQMGTCVEQPESSGAQTNNLLEQPSKSDLRKSKSSQVEQSGSCRGKNSPCVEQPEISRGMKSPCVEQRGPSGSLINSRLEPLQTTECSSEASVPESPNSSSNSLSGLYRLDQPKAELASTPVEQSGPSADQPGWSADQPGWRADQPDSQAVIDLTSAIDDDDDKDAVVLIIPPPRPPSETIILLDDEEENDLDIVIEKVISRDIAPDPILFRNLEPEKTHKRSNLNRGTKPTDNDDEEIKDKGSSTSTLAAPNHSEDQTAEKTVESPSPGSNDNQNGKRSLEGDLTLSRPFNLPPFKKVKPNNDRKDEIPAGVQSPMTSHTATPHVTPPRAQRNANRVTSRIPRTFVLPAFCQIPHTASPHVTPRRAQRNANRVTSRIPRTFVLPAFCQNPVGVQSDPVNTSQATPTPPVSNTSIVATPGTAPSNMMMPTNTMQALRPPIPHTVTPPRAQRNAPNRATPRTPHPLSREDSWNLPVLPYYSHAQRNWMEERKRRLQYRDSFNMPPVVWNYRHNWRPNAWNPMPPWYQRPRRDNVHQVDLRAPDLVPIDPEPAARTPVRQYRPAAAVRRAQGQEQVQEAIRKYSSP